MNKKTTLLLAILPAIALVLLFSFCKGDPKTTTQNPADARGNTVVIRMESAASSLNPYPPTVGYSVFVQSRIFQTLGTHDPQTLEMKPLLAMAIPISHREESGPYKGTLSYTFEINPLATWDNGSPITAADVLFTMKIIFHPEFSGTYRGYYPYLKAVEVDPANPKKFTAYFTQYYFQALESLCETPIMPAYNYDPGGKLANIPMADFLDTSRIKTVMQQNPNIKAFATEFQDTKYVKDPKMVSGSAAYRVQSFSTDQGIVLVRKHPWWGDQAMAQNPALAAYPEKLEYRFVREDAATETMLRNNELDVARAIGGAKFNELKADPKLAALYDFQVTTPSQYSRWFFNQRLPKFQDKRVRQAIAHAINYDYMTNTVMQGLGKRVVGPVGPGKSYYAKDLTPYDFNPAKARELLTAAGWKDSDGDGVMDQVLKGKKTDLSIDLLAPVNSVTSEQISASLKESAQQAGIRINIVKKPAEEISRDAQNGDFESVIMLAALSPGLEDFYQNYHSRSVPPAGTNRAAFANAEADRLIERIRTTEDEGQRSEYYRQFQKVFYEEVPEVILYAPVQRIVFSKRFDYVMSNNHPGYYEQYFKLKNQN